MLNLRQVDQNSDNSLSNMAQISTIRFSMSIALGNIGESLEFGTRRYDDNLEDESDANVIAPLAESSASPDTRSV
jgi:hypothetical protein